MDIYSPWILWGYCFGDFSETENVFVDADEVLRKSSRGVGINSAAGAKSNSPNFINYRRHMSSQDMITVHKAAALIQAVYKGYKIRKVFKHILKKLISD